MNNLQVTTSGLHYTKIGRIMKIGVSIVHYVVKVPNLVQIIVTIYRVQGYKIPIVNPRLPRKIQDGRHEI